MSEKEMNSYRLTSMEEPTDEMLSQLMKEVAEEAKCKSEEAHRKFFTELRTAARVQRREVARKQQRMEKCKTDNDNE
ncbi:hypothetical protein [Bacteroides sp.]|uniref:hypothetical protein n=1 Tax=Bacteroides sp. TaxID=29523 RepID=UPI0025BEAC34|nr:hypothetical protein [Bacteroides sp.]